MSAVRLVPFTPGPLPAGQPRFEHRIDEDNAPSRAAAAAAGFAPLTEEPDAEGMVFVRWTRS